MPFIYLDGDVQMTPAADICRIDILGICYDGRIAVTLCIVISNDLFLIGLIFSLVELRRAEQLEPEVRIQKFFGGRKGKKPPMAQVLPQGYRIMRTIGSLVGRRIDRKPAKFFRIL